MKNKINLKNSDFFIDKDGKLCARLPLEFTPNIDKDGDSFSLECGFNIIKKLNNEIQKVELTEVSIVNWIPETKVESTFVIESGNVYPKQVICNWYEHDGNGNTRIKESKLFNLIEKNEI